MEIFLEEISIFQQRDPVLNFLLLFVSRQKVRLIKDNDYLLLTKLHYTKKNNSSLAVISAPLNHQNQTQLRTLPKNQKKQTFPYPSPAPFFSEKKSKKRKPIKVRFSTFANYYKHRERVENH